MVLGVFAQLLCLTLRMLRYRGDVCVCVWEKMQVYKIRFFLLEQWESAVPGQLGNKSRNHCWVPRCEGR